MVENVALRSRSNLIDGKRKKPFANANGFFLAEMERFELSRRFPDLHP